MRRMVALCLIFSFIFPLAAQDSESSESHEPAPYTDEEFSNWSKDLRRGEIILFGSLPFTMLFSGLGYRTVKYAYNNYTVEPGVEIPDWDVVNRQDQINMIYISLGLSLSIAIFDYILGKIEERSDDKL